MTHTANTDSMKREYNNSTSAAAAQTVNETINALIEVFSARAPRSAWKRGVNAYAVELLESFQELNRYQEQRHGQSLSFTEENFLNGAPSWWAYSYGGSSLIYNTDIAQRLCTPSELKRCKGGEKDPNPRELWIDVQGRALFQAWHQIKRAAEEIK